MARKAVVDAVEARMAANFTGPPVFGMNTDQDPPRDGSAFIEIQYPFCTEEQMSLGDPGNNIWREEGGVRIVINAPRDRGKGQMLAWADQISAIYRGKDFDGVRCWGVDAMDLDDGSYNDNYFQSSVVVSYWHDISG